LKILSVSDEIVSFIYSPQISQKFGDVDFVIACGDLPYFYQEFIISMLDIPLFFVRGNHDPEVECGECGERSYPHGGINLHRNVVRWNDVLLAGVEGSIRYKTWGKFQYTQAEMWRHVFSLIPGLWINRLLYGRYLDIFVTHASPWGIHDRNDIPHRGIKAFRWFISVFKPKYHFHGHIHIYRPDDVTRTYFGSTQVLNTYQYRETDLEVERGNPSWWQIQARKLTVRSP
jgi:Icc-related predicted phosphoesterase